MDEDPATPDGALAQEGAEWQTADPAALGMTDNTWNPPLAMITTTAAIRHMPFGSGLKDCAQESQEGFNAHVDAEVLPFASGSMELLRQAIKCAGPGSALHRIRLNIEMLGKELSPLAWGAMLDMGRCVPTAWEPPQQWRGNLVMYVIKGCLHCALVSQMGGVERQQSMCRRAGRYGWGTAASCRWDMTRALWWLCFVKRRAQKRN